MKFAIVYKPGRAIAWPQLFDTRKQAERVIASMPEVADALHIVTTEQS